MKLRTILPAVFFFIAAAAQAWSAAAPSSYDQAVNLHRAGKFKEAIAAYDKAIQADPKSARAFVGRGEAYARLGQTERAVKDFDQAIKLSPKTAEGYYYRGNAYSDAKQP